MIKFNSLRYILATGIAVLIASSTTAQAVGTGYLNVNNVNAGFGSSGNFFTSFAKPTDSVTSGFLLYEVPKGTNKRAIFTSALWMGGMDAGNNLHLAAQRYFDTGKDYYPGPVGDTGSSQVQYCKQVFVITRAAVNQFQALSFPASWNSIDSSILDWPAKGNTFLDTFKQVNITSYLAPFVDVDGDGIYNPSKGDYPDFCGDDAVFFVYNDSAGPHGESGGANLGVEVRALATEYNDTAINGLPYEKNAINNTVFLMLDVENKSPNNYTNFNLGLFEDPDLGCFNNDRVGCDTNRNLMFAYNGTTPDPDCNIETGYGFGGVAQGVIMLNQDIDKFVYYVNGAIAAQTDPTTAAQYENYLTGFWNDGTAFTYGGTGYAGLQPTNFCFPGDPNDTSQWSELQVANILPPGDRRMTGSTGPSTFNAGEIKHFDLAFLTSYDSLSGMFKIVDTLKRDADRIKSYYNSIVVPCRGQLPTAIKNISGTDNLDFAVYPNPANNQITVQAGNLIQSIELTDVEGRVINQQVNLPDRCTIDISNLAKGIYLIKVMSAGKMGTKKVVID